MSGSSQLLCKILTNIHTGDQPQGPQLLTPFEFFVKIHYKDMIQPAIIKQWTESNTAAIESCDRTVENGHYCIPTSFCDKVTLQLFEDLSASELSNIKRSSEKAYEDAVLAYKDKMKRLYQDDHRGIDCEGSSGALIAATRVLQPVMAALEALTGLQILTWAGGSVINGFGVAEITTDQFRGQPADLSPLIIPNSQADIFRRAAEEWMLRKGNSFIEKWLSAPQKEARIITEHGGSKRKSSSDNMPEVRLFKKSNITSTSASSPIVLEHGLISHAAITPLHVLGHETMTGYSLEPGSVSQPRLPGISASSEDPTTQYSFDLHHRDPDPSSQPPLMPTVGQQDTRSIWVHYDTTGHPDEPNPPDATADQAESLHRDPTYQPNIPSTQTAKTRPIENTGNEDSTCYAHLLAAIPSTSRNFINLLQGLNIVTKGDLGTSFRLVVLLLIEVETLYSRSSRLPSRLTRTDGRPEELKKWIGDGRTNVIVVKDVKQFSQKWWSWWRVLQPNWRRFDADGMPSKVLPILEDWTCLQSPGVNGMLSVVAALHGWGLAVKDNSEPLGSGEQRANWLMAVEDCRWVLERLVLYARGS